MLPTSSIAMVTYNGEKYLQRQLDSLVKQTVLPGELVVCDDGSTDRTMEILRQFAQTAPFPVRIFQNERNLGICANFCKVFYLCEKEVTFFCDQDDVWFPQKLEKALKVMESKPEVGLVLTYDERIDGNDQPLRNREFSDRLTAALEKEELFPALFHQRHLGWAAHNMACRTCWREILLKRGWAPTAFDWWIFHLMGLWNRIDVIPEPMCRYRRHGESVSSHSRGEKNPFHLLYNSIKRHQDIQYLYWKYRCWQEIVIFFQGRTDLFYPEIFTYYQQTANHLQARIEILAHPRQRLWFLARELFTKRYFRYSKGLRDAFSDLIAWPQPLPEGFRKEVGEVEYDH